jgi:16S rRNA (guanine(966)-N(2))-methyltransferase RsmD
MSVRITGGALRGRVVEVPDAEDLRPTPSMAREALFSMLGQRLDGWRVVDLCAGSGVMSLEFASRGAQVDACERNPKTARHLRATFAQLGAQITVHVGDAAALLGALPAEPALVYLDPPFRQDLVAWLALGASLQPRRLILEHPTTLSPPREAGALVLDRRRTYGGVALALYEAPPRSALG